LSKTIQEVVRAMPFQKITATKVEDLITFNGEVSYDDLVEVILEHDEHIYLTASWVNFPSIWPLVLVEDLASDIVKAWLKNVRGPLNESLTPRLGNDENVLQGLIVEDLEIGRKPSLRVTKGEQLFRYTFFPIVDFRPASRRSLNTS
jgi:hypothetical protein